MKTELLAGLLEGKANVPRSCHISILSWGSLWVEKQESNLGASQVVQKSQEHLARGEI